MGEPALRDTHSHRLIWVKITILSFLWSFSLSLFLAFSLSCFIMFILVIILLSLFIIVLLISDHFRKHYHFFISFLFMCFMCLSFSLILSFFVYLLFTIFLNIPSRSLSKFSSLYLSLLSMASRSLHRKRFYSTVTLHYSTATVIPCVDSFFIENDCESDPSIWNNHGKRGHTHTFGKQQRLLLLTRKDDGP